MEKNKVIPVITFVAGGLTFYIVARISVPYFKNRIAEGIATRIVERQNTVFSGVLVMNRGEAYRTFGVPLADEVLTAMYLQ